MNGVKFNRIMGKLFSKHRKLLLTSGFSLIKVIFLKELKDESRGRTYFRRKIRGRVFRKFKQFASM